MTHRERVMMAVAHEEPDRGPRDIAGTKCTSIHRTAYAHLIDLLKIEAKPTVEQVEEEVKQVIRDLAPGGGYVLNFVHNAQPDVQAENICAMFEAAERYGTYPL
jgi:hypothetical protein